MRVEEWLQVVLTELGSIEKSVAEFEKSQPPNTIHTIFSYLQVDKTRCCCLKLSKYGDIMVASVLIHEMVRSISSRN
jgi:hypothetical protein